MESIQAFARNVLQKVQEYGILNTRTIFTGKNSEGSIKKNTIKDILRNFGMRKLLREDEREGRNFELKSSNCLETNVKSVLSLIRGFLRSIISMAVANKKSNISEPKVGILICSMYLILSKQTKKNIDYFVPTVTGWKHGEDNTLFCENCTELPLNKKKVP